MYMCDMALLTMCMVNHFMLASQGHCAQRWALFSAQDTSVLALIPPLDDEPDSWLASSLLCSKTPVPTRLHLSYPQLTIHV